MSHLLIGANSTKQANYSTKTAPSIRTVTYDIVGKSSKISVPVPLNGDEKVFAARVDYFYTSAVSGTQDIMLGNLGELDPNKWDLTKNELSGAYMLKEIINEENEGIRVEEFPLSTDTKALQDFEDLIEIDGLRSNLVKGTTIIRENNVLKFKDPFNADRITYVFNPNYHRYIVIKSDDLESRYIYDHEDNKGILGIAIPIGSQLIGGSNGYIFKNRSEDIANVRTFLHNIDIDLCYESIVSNYYPMTVRPERYLYFPQTYEVIVTLYVKSVE